MIGILFGLYCNISIALFVLCLFYGLVGGILKCKNGKRYDTVLEIKKWMILFMLCILCSCIWTHIQNQEYEKKNRQMKQSKQYVGVIVSNPLPKEYSTQYLLKVKKAENDSTNITVYLCIKGQNHFEYGDEICFIGEYQEPDVARNDKGFDYKQYLKSNRNCWNGYHK